MNFPFTSRKEQITGFYYRNCLKMRAIVHFVVCASQQHASGGQNIMFSPLLPTQALCFLVALLFALLEAVLLFCSAAIKDYNIA